MVTEKDTIDIRKLLRKIIVRKKLFYKVWGITFVLSALFIICVPRYYSTSAKLAPELSGNGFDGGALGSIASSFGFDMSNLQSSDAISPLLYPDLMDDNGFVTRLFSVHVTSADGEIDTDYYTYLKEHQKNAWWSVAFMWFKKLFKSSKVSSSDDKELDPYHLSQVDDGIANSIKGNIQLTFDKKTGVITITANAQDPVICKTLADTVQTYLQQFITDYRTKKARVDAEYYEKLVTKARLAYDEARETYVAYADANQNAVLQHVLSTISDLENDMQLKLNNYTAYNTQLQAALAKIQERTPAFTIIKGADVPVRPKGPKRVSFVLCMTLLTTFGVIAYILLNQFKKTIDQM